MRIKSYFASSVAEAMEKARRELGSEAMLMNSKKTEAELRSLGAYEVVFGVPPENPRTSEIQPAPAANAGNGVSLQGSNDLVRELAELRKQIETVKRSVDRRPAALAASGPPLSAECGELLARLTAADLSEESAMELALAAAARAANEGSGNLESALRAECEQRLRFAPSLNAAGDTPGAIVLVGPTGVGKTTTLVKLALRLGMRGRAPIQLLSLDTLRIGGWEQLASYARIAGLACQALHTPAALDQAFAEFRRKQLLLIDTPGFSPADEAQWRGLAAWSSAHRHGVEVQLVLSAAAQTRVNLKTIERFAAFSPAKLLFTHLDEAEGTGPMLETALRSGLPLSFLGAGQQVPEDLWEATLDRVIGTLASGGHEGRRVASAA
jgi:flagellar biosynthesis protein FlhF